MGKRIAALVFPLEISYTPLNLIGTLSEPNDGTVKPKNVFSSQLADSVFESISFNQNYGNGTNPDTLLFGFIDFGDSQWTAGGDVWRLDLVPTAEGTIEFDTILLPPFNFLTAVDDSGVHQTKQWLGDSRVLHVVSAPAMELQIEACPDPDLSTAEGGAAAIYVEAITLSGTFQSLDLLSVTKDSLPAVPTHAPVLLGLSQVDVPAASELIAHWVTVSGEAGLWEFQFVGTNNLGDSVMASTSVTVVPVDSNNTAWEPRRYTYDPGDLPFEAELPLDFTTAVNPTAGVVLGSVLRSTAGGAFMVDPVSEIDVVWPAALAGVESKSVSAFSNDAVSEDSILLGLISFSGGFPTGTYRIGLTTALDTLEGIISAEFPVLCFPPASTCASYSSVPGDTYFPTTSDGCWPITIARYMHHNGDGDQSDNLTAADLILLVNYIFKAGPEPQPCVAVGDINCDGSATSSDIILLVNHVFKSMPPPCDIDQLIPGIWQCP
jgi:hypothetical protein